MLIAKNPAFLLGKVRFQFQLLLIEEMLELARP